LKRVILNLKFPIIIAHRHPFSCRTS
jgi:hypothetical protein